MPLPSRKSRTSVQSKPGSDFEESYRYILANLEMNPSIQRGSQTILITSSNPGEGKTFTTTHLARVLAEANKRVLLVDANLRDPQLHHHFKAPVELGLGEVLEQRIDVEKALVSTEVHSLYLLAGGAAASDASHLLSSPALQQVLVECKAMFDIVLIDGPSVLSVSDPLVIGRVVDGVILVVDSKHTNRLLAQRALAALQRANGNIIGGVLNRIPKNAKSNYHFIGTSIAE